MKTKLFLAFRAWIPLAVAVTVLSGLVYVAVQQNYRMNANDPQIQLAEDVANGLSNGKKLGQFNEQLDMAKSLSAFMIVYDDKGTPVASSVALNGNVPTISAGVMDYVRTHGEDRLTWEPQPGIRNAIVVTRYTGTSTGFILAGRSLREVEQRERMLTFYVFSAWVAAVILLFVAVVLLGMFPKTGQEA